MALHHGYPLWKFDEEFWRLVLLLVEFVLYVSPQEGLQ